MLTNDSHSVSSEKVIRAASGWQMLPVNFGLLFFGALMFVLAPAHGSILIAVCGLFVAIVAIVLLTGHFTLQPNESRLLILFGEYHGTVRESGFYWANPFYARSRARVPLANGATTAVKMGEHASAQSTVSSRALSAKISLRARNFNSEIIKVNDKNGNPVEIAAVIVWRVADTAKAAFDVDDFDNYVHIQSESALRHMASLYAYDHGEEHEATLRGGADEVALALSGELRVRLEKAGVIVEEARLTHLAYAPEIAQLMLRRQQAEAVIAPGRKSCTAR